MKKAIGQTVRDLKREVNKKVLKVPSIEQKMLDATSNEAWGPHGTLLAEIANASRNYHEYQMIMSVVWKRINDTGKNWRHVYKALIVLEYLVGHGSERVIDEIREHAYQIQTLSDFQYIDSSGRDQGNNVRRKSQSLVVLVNDKDRIQEVREKAAANRDKYRNTSGGGMYRPGSHGSIGGYDDDRYGGRDEDRNGYGRGRESSRDDDRYGRYGDGDRYSRDDDRYGYKDDDYRGRSRSTDDYQYGTRSRSADHDQDRSYEDDGQYSSSRGNGAKADDQSQDGSSTGRQLERKSSDQSPGAPPSYEEAVSAGRSPTFSERDGEIPSGSAAKSTSPSATGVPSQSANNYTSPPSAASPPPPFSVENESNGFDEFDPRGSFHAAPNAPNAASPVASAAPATTGNADMDLLGGLSESFSTNSLALVPTTAYTTPSEDVQVNASSGSGFAAASPASSFSNQAFDDPFGDGPFRAVPTSSDYPSQQSVSSTPFDATPNLSSEPPQFSDVQSSAAASSQFSTQESSSLDFDVLADILPPTTGLQQNASSETVYAAQNGQPSLETGFPPQSSPTAEQITYPPQQGQGTSPTSFHSQPGQPAMQVGFHPQSGQHVPPPNVHNSQPVPVAGFPSQVGPHTSYTSQPIPQNANFYGSYNQQMASAGPYAPQMSSQFSLGPTAQQNPGNYGSATPTSQMMSNAPLVSQPIASSSTGTLALVPQPAKEKFETKSTVWADTLNRGLVNLNISGPKTNPLADIGVDFDAMNRREKRFEKPTNAPTVSNVSMGKAMGSGSGIGRAGAGALRPAPNSAMGSGMAMGVGGGPGQGMGMAGYPPANQPMGGMGMHPNPNMGMGMGMGMGQAGQMQQRPMGFPPGSNMPQGYNPAMGMGYYGQQPYGGGYR